MSGAARMLPAHMGVGNLQDSPRISRFDLEFEDAKGRFAGQLADKFSNRLTPALMTALAKPEYKERLDTEIEMMFQRIELLSSK